MVNERYVKYKDVTAKDDWSLTLKELESQRVQLQLQLAVVESGIDFVLLKLNDYNSSAALDAAEVDVGRG